MAISNIVINKPILKGNNAPIAKTPPAVRMFQVKTDNIVNNKCPAVTFAANLKPKDSALAQCDTNSTKTKNGPKPNGAPAGINIEI